MLKIDFILRSKGGHGEGWLDQEVLSSERDHGTLVSHGLRTRRSWSRSCGRQSWSLGKSPRLIRQTSRLENHENDNTHSIPRPWSESTLHFLDVAARADFVIEAISENPRAKRELFHSLDRSVLREPSLRVTRPTSTYSHWSKTNALKGVDYHCGLPASHPLSCGSGTPNLKGNCGDG